MTRPGITRLLLVVQSVHVPFLDGGGIHELRVVAGDGWYTTSGRRIHHHRATRVIRGRDVRRVASPFLHLHEVATQLNHISDAVEHSVCHGIDSVECGLSAERRQFIMYKGVSPLMLVLLRI
jgi:hypothetical protein